MRWLGLETRDEATPTPSDTSEQLWPPPRDRAADTEPRTLIPLYRALSILTGAAAQLPLTLERAGQRVTNPALIPSHIRRPDPNLDRATWIEQAVLSLALTGNLFVYRSDTALRILPAQAVSVAQSPTGQLSYHYNSQPLDPINLSHQALLRAPGELRGIGPIQAARLEIAGAVDVREYATNWFSGSGQPAGMITAKSVKTATEAKEIRDAWNQAQQDPNNISGVRVIGGEATYTPLLLSPSDAQWLEVRAFAVTDFARLFGIPSSLLLAPIDGANLTYTNVESEWIGFVRFTLSQYTRKIEEALTALTPLGQTVRFNFDALLRSDTKSRYEAYEIGLRAGWLTTDEVRALEGLNPKETHAKH